MKESEVRIQDEGKSRLLLELAKRVTDEKKGEDRLSPECIFPNSIAAISASQRHNPSTSSGNEKRHDDLSPNAEGIEERSGVCLSGAIHESDMDTCASPRKEVSIENAAWLNKEVNSMEELLSINSRVGTIIITSNSCNNREIEMLDMSGFVHLKELHVNDDCFENVKEVKLIGLHALQKVVIGMKCFTTHKKDMPRTMNPYRHFYLKDCERLKELKIGCYSFSDFSVCEIANLPSLEVIEMGVVDKKTYNFKHASLELKSDGDGMK